MPSSKSRYTISCSSRRPQRRSRRLMALSTIPVDVPPPDENTVCFEGLIAAKVVNPRTSRKRTQRTEPHSEVHGDCISIRPKNQRSQPQSETTLSDTVCKGASDTRYTMVTLPRTLEEAIRRGDLFHRESGDTPPVPSSLPLHVLGIDEAGRGPLAGPVVAAAVILPPDTPNVPGVIDSKRITTEANREALYEQIVAVPGVVWAVAVVDASTIDTVNILQATLMGMRLAANAVVGKPMGTDVNVVAEANVNIKGGYVVASRSATETGWANHQDDTTAANFYALVDGNRVPLDMPCRGHAVVKGDSIEYCIAAASILAKVTRDRLMHGYDKLYPEYGIHQHKGYPTAMHMQAVKRYGASPIHRRTFAPLKHMRLDAETGAVLEDET